MPQTKDDFLSRVSALPPGPGVSLDDVLKPSIEDETELRRLWATDRTNTRLSDPYVGLVDVFAAPEDIRKARTRVVANDEDLTAKYVMPLDAEKRKAEGEPTMVADLDEFKKNWAIFTEGSLSQLLDWNNVIAAGGSVLGCLAPLDEKHKVSKRAIRKHYHSAAYPTSDVDLFLWGLTPEEAERKIVKIYEAVRDSIPWDVTCIRTKHTVSIHSQYPYRAVQIVLRLYQSPAEVLAGFDVDAPCFAYDGTKVWGNPRAIVASMRQCNTIDITRRSPSYEVRLAKYAARGFEVFVPDLNREKIDPTIYERSIFKMEGLARLLVFEKLRDGDARYSFLESRRQLRGRPNPLARYQRQKQGYKGDLKEQNAIGGLEMNDYDVASLHIPYGPGWDARRIQKLVYQTDLGMNSTFNPKNKDRRLHRHPAFFGTMEECIEDCCEYCPEPIDDDERKLQTDEAEMYITGRIKFLEDDPGRQSMTGSFKPIDVGEWSEQVYVKESDKFFAAIAANDIETVKAYLKAGELDLNNRDHVGRTCLHVALFSNAPEVALALIDADARISARLADGRSAFHLAARYDQLEVVKKLLERNASNKEQVKKDEENDDDAMEEDKPERPSSADDWSSDDNDGKDADVDMADAEDDDGEGDDEDEDGDDDGDGDGDEDSEGSGNSEGAGGPPSTVAAGDLPEDNEDEPDIFEIDVADWDFGFSALSYAVLFASPVMVETLLEAGADATAASSTGHRGADQQHPLALTILREDEDEACQVAEKLIAKGATSSTADSSILTIFHRFIAAKKTKLAALILKSDPNASLVLNLPAIRYSDVNFPVVTAIANKDYSTLAVLLAHGAKLDLSAEDITRARDAADPKDRSNLFGYGVTNYLDQCNMPLETAISIHDDVAQLLLASGAAYNLAIKQGVTYYASEGDRGTIKDWVDHAILSVDYQIEKLETVVVAKPKREGTPMVTPWKQHFMSLQEPEDDEPTNVDTEAVGNYELQMAYDRAKELQEWKSTREYLSDIQRLLSARSAKGWEELFPDVKRIPWTPPSKPAVEYPEDEEEKNTDKYIYNTNRYRSNPVPEHLNAAYDDLFDACFTGNDARIEELCLPAKAGEDVKAPLNVNVQAKGKYDSYYSSSGYTPLFAAIEGRHWATAKLILAIAASQYAPPKDGVKVRFSVSNIRLDQDSDGDSDSDSDCSDDSDATVQETRFVDIAKVSSTVRSDRHPRNMLSEIEFTWRKKKIGQRTSNFLTRAVETEDLDAFIKIADLYASLSEPVDLGHNLLDTIIAADSPEILHEYIRRSGYGLDFEQAKKAIEHLPPIVNDKNRVYLGLNVNGKKRADLARKNDPNAAGSVDVIPLVWQAARAGANKILEYLAGDKPLAAFRYHATACSTSRAEQLRRTPDWGQALPKWLGWLISDLGESPLSAAILGNNLETIKVLFAKQPKLLKSALHEKIKFCGFNAFLLASTRYDTNILDFLLAKSVSPAERDTTKGWNVFHFACSNNKVPLVQYLLKKLPKDVSQALLTQESKIRRNTPLHLAASTGAYKVIDILVKLEPGLATVRNIDGQTPLHLACDAKWSNSASILLDAAPRAIFMENAVGQTPFDTIYQEDLASRASQRFDSHTRGSTLTPSDVPRYPQRAQISVLEEQIPRLKETVEWLLAEGRPVDPDTFKFNLTSFIATLESQLALAKESEKKLPPLPVKEVVEDHSPYDNRNIQAIYQLFKNKIESKHNERRDLIKLLDVQLSVKANLDKAANKTERQDVDSDDEEDEEKVAWRGAMVYGAIDLNPDRV
ncbi:ankyrin repeat protein [Coprinopsis sp. MPI-PUGE-AT-0042]|nr:ankyrin repeat protein [Coprinopsis sp. MPI-PUGE-AT-0042]